MVKLLVYKIICFERAFITSRGSAYYNFRLGHRYPVVVKGLKFDKSLNERLPSYECGDDNLFLCHSFFHSNEGTNISNTGIVLSYIYSSIFTFI